MEELIFFGVIILFSILDAIAKKKRQGTETEEVEAPPTEASPVEDEARWGGMPGYEAPSSDPDGDGIPGAPLPEYTRPYGGEGASSSEGMVPRDIWEEIGALARGEQPPEPVAPEPDEEELATWDDEPSYEDPERLPSRIPSTSPIRRSQVGAREVGSRGGSGKHFIHGSHADYGTDPSGRKPVPEPASGGPSREVRAVRQALMEGGSDAARRAVILHEILGPPVAYRDEGGGGSEV